MDNQLEMTEYWNEELQEVLRPIYEFDDKPFEYGERNIIISIDDKYSIELVDIQDEQRLMEVNKYEDGKNIQLHISWALDQIEEIVVITNEPDEDIGELFYEALEYLKSIIDQGAKCEERSLPKTLTLYIK